MAVAVAVAVVVAVVENLVFSVLVPGWQLDCPVVKQITPYMMYNKHTAANIILNLWDNLSKATHSLYRLTS